MALPDRIFAQASPLSIGGRPLFAEAKASINSFNVGAYSSAPNVVGAATTRLRTFGFDVLQVTPYTINISGKPALFRTTFRTDIVEKEVARPNGTTTTYLDSPQTKTLGLISTAGTAFADVLEGVGLEAPRSLLDVSPLPPAVDYWHLQVPEGIAVGCNAAAAHKLGITGQGVKVAFVDTGFYRHPYFAAQGYNVAPVVLGPGATAPEDDESGHGTGECANLLAIAPGCQLLPVKMNFVNTIGAFNQAVALQPDIISCSWGSHSPFELSAADMVLEASVAAAVASGITVVFAAGNGHAGFPGQHPDVISAGGVFMDETGSLEASSYASGFQSLIYFGRRVPDVSGLCGQRPKAIYIMLPVQPGDSIDVGNAGSVFPDGDQTEADDGWAAFSGTSAAAPQVAGAAALIKGLVPSISPLGIKTALMASARDVNAGFCSPVGDIHQGLPALPGPDDATGSGLLDVLNALVYGYLTNTHGTQASMATDAAYAAAYWQGYMSAAMAASLCSACTPRVT
jgi:subtilisin family serine protease